MFLQNIYQTFFCDDMSEITLISQRISVGLALKFFR